MRLELRPQNAAWNGVGDGLATAKWRLKSLPSNECDAVTAKIEVEAAGPDLPPAPNCLVWD